MRNRLLTICLLMALVVATVVGYGMDYGKIIDRWNSASVSVLNDRGRACVRRHIPDSALVFFSMAANKYDKSMPDSDKAACSAASNNMGYIYFYHRNDYSSAYTCLLKALEIADDAKAEKMYPFIYLNIANIYVNYKDDKTAHDLYRKAFHASMKTGNHTVAIISLCNLVSQSVADDDVASIMPEVRTFRRLHITDTELLGYAQEMCNVAESLAAGDTAVAMSALTRSLNRVDTQLTPERYTFSSYMMMAHIQASSGNYQEAIATMKKVETLSDGTALDLQAEACETLSVYYGCLGDSQQSMRWHTKSLQLSDSLFRSQQYGLIRDIKSTYEIKKIDSRMRDIDNRRHNIQTALVIVGISLLIVMLMACIIYQKNRKLTRRNKDLYLRNEEMIRMSDIERKQRIRYERRIAEYEKEAESRRQEKGTATEEAGSKPKYQGSSLDDFRKQQLLDKISGVMDNVEEISMTDFSIERLARLTESNTRYVSQVINEAHGKNFSTLLGEARVRQACLRLCDTNRYGNLTIEAIATGLGFKSRSNFVTVFKRVTGLTPSEYKKIGIANTSIAK